LVKGRAEISIEIALVKMKYIFHRLTFLLPLLLGFLVFWFIAGLNILRPENIGWLAGGLDPTQHYLGWVFFRNGPWGFPLGLNPYYGMELSSAIVFSDSIPLLAFIFKPIAAALSQPFQYFGVWTLGCFILQAWFAWLLLSLVTLKTNLRLFGTALLLVSPAMIWRVGVTSALVAHFLILAGLYLNFRPTIIRRRLYWIFLLTCTALIHFYLLVMVFALWCADFIDRYLTHQDESYRKNGVELISVFGFLIFILWQAGYFLVDTTVAATGNYGIGRMNILSPFDSNNWSYILGDIAETPKSYSTADFILSYFEGYNYFGIGVIGVLLLGVGKFVWLKLSKAKININSPTETNRVIFCFQWRRYRALLCILILLTLFAISNKISVGLFIFHIPLPDQLISFASILRASGRLFWPSLYTIVWLGLALVIFTYSNQRATLILFFALIIQIVDTSAGWGPVRERLMQSPTSQWHNSLKDPFWNYASQQFSALKRIPAQNNALGWEVLANYAQSHNWPTNSVFLSRVDEAKIIKANQNLEIAMAKASYDPKTLYVLADDKVIPALLHINPKQDLLARINDLNIVAPGWLTCLQCPEVLPTQVMSAFIPDFKWNIPIDFSRDRGNNLSLVMVSGWDYPQPWGTWALGKEAKLVLPLPRSQLNRKIDDVDHLRVITRAVVNSIYPKQAVEVWINGQLQQTVVLQKGEGEVIDIALPKEVKELGYCTITFHFPDAVRPIDISMGDDTRLLSMGIISATFY